MEPFCLTFSGKILPVVKSLIASKMMDEYKLSQNKIAEILEMTQPAISQYKRSLRGNRVELIEKNSEITSLIHEITKELALGELSEQEKNTVYCRICKAMRNTK